MEAYHNMFKENSYLTSSQRSKLKRIQNDIFNLAAEVGDSEDMDEALEELSKALMNTLRQYNLT